jgi:RNA polymerase sigma-70 factor, ECF subfamily
MSGKEQTDIIDHLKDLSDEELALEAGSGSGRSFEILIQRYTTRLFQFLRQRLPTDQDAEDITQEAFIKAYQNMHRYDSQWKFSTWLYTIASRLAISHYRANKKNAYHLSLNESAQPLTSTANCTGPRESLIKQQDSQNLWTLASALKPNHYEALWLRYGEEFTVKEIADVLKKTPLHVRVLLHRARLKLSKLMAQQMASGDSQTGIEKNSAPLPTFSLMVLLACIFSLIL